MITRQELLDLYSDYLISSFGQTTGTGLAALLDGRVSHDQVQRFLAGPPATSVDLWRLVKPAVRQMQSTDGVLIVDDSIVEKPYTDENALICWHYDHAQQRSVKGINFLTALYHSREVSLPVGFALITKEETYLDKEGKPKRRSSVSKNELFRQLVQQAVINQIPFGYVLSDIWYAAAENMLFIRHALDKHFVLPLKANRKVALSLADKQHGRYQWLDTLVLEPGVVQEVYLEQVDFPLLLVKQRFTNEDGSCGIQYLVTSDTTLTPSAMSTIYHKRWNVEPYHKSLKQNAALEKSPTHTIRTQTNHFFAALYAYVKLELLKVSTHLNHFALKTRLYLRAVRVAYDTLRALQPARLAA